MNPHHIQPLLNHRYPIAESASGIYIYDKSGKEYLDGSSGAMCCGLGHSHPRIIARIKKQADKLQFVYRSQFGSDEAEMLAEKLFEISPDKNFPHVFFVNSGSEAIETAIKTALQYWQEQGLPHKKKFITRRKSYHGITMGALSVTGHSNRRHRFEASLQKNISFDADPEKDAIDKHIGQIEALLSREDANDIAALLLEPMVGAAGSALTPLPGYYQELRKLCDRHNILFIADEVLSGIGRTGRWFALEHWDSLADITTIGKSLGAGYAPIAACMISEKVLAPIRMGSGLIMSGHTYSGHPLSCAVAHEVVLTIEEEALLGQINRMGDYLKDSLLKVQKDFQAIEIVRGKGLFCGFELYPKYAGLRDSLIEKCFTNGLLIYPAVGGPDGTTENGALICPPYIITRDGVDELIDKLAKSLKQIHGVS